MKPRKIDWMHKIVLPHRYFLFGIKKTATSKKTFLIRGEFFSCLRRLVACKKWRTNYPTKVVNHSQHSWQIVSRHLFFKTLYILANKLFTSGWKKGKKRRKKRLALREIGNLILEKAPLKLFPVGNFLQIGISRLLYDYIPILCFVK